MCVCLASLAGWVSLAMPARPFARQPACPSVPRFLRVCLSLRFCMCGHHLSLGILRLSNSATFAAVGAGIYVSGLGSGVVRGFSKGKFGASAHTVELDVLDGTQATLYGCPIPVSVLSVRGCVRVS